MGINFATLDSRSLSQLCQDLQSEPAQVAESLLQAVAKRLRIPASRFTFNIMPYGTDLGPSYRTEWSELLRQGKTFAGKAQSAAVAAQFSQVQLFNPAGSGKVVLVLLGVTSAKGVAMDTLVTLDGAAAATDVGTGQNLLGGGAGLAHLRTSSIGVVPSPIAEIGNGTNSDRYELAPGGFIAELAEGRGISLWGGVVNSLIVGSFFWAEVDALYPR